MSVEGEKMSQSVGRGPRSSWMRMYLVGEWLMRRGMRAVWGVERDDSGPGAVNRLRTVVSTSLLIWFVC